MSLAMASVKLHGHLTTSAATVRRKPALTYQSPAHSTVVLHFEKTLFASQSAAAPPLPTPPPTRLSPTPEPSQGSSAVLHKPNRHHMTPLLPLYHPFGTLALSLPDLDPTAFGLPAPVAVFDDPTRRSSNRQRRPAAKVRDADDPAASNPPLFAVETPAPESEIKEKPSPRRRRAGGKRKRKEPEDGDATYPAKRSRNPRSSGLSSLRAFSREDASPALSNRTSPALDAGRSDLTEEKKPERRATRSRAITRRGSTASEETTTSASPSVTATAPRVGSSGEPVETDEHTTDTLNEAPATGIESQKAEPDDAPVLEQQGS